MCIVYLWSSLTAAVLLETHRYQINVIKVASNQVTAAAAAAAACFFLHGASSLSKV